MSFELDLIEIALRDIKASEILYENKLYAQSYFYFQQASEKANKALGLFADIISKNDLKNIQHNQLKIHRTALVSQEAEMLEFSKNLKSNLKIAEHPFLKKEAMENHLQNLKEGLKFYDSAKQLDLLNYTKEELNGYLDEMDELKKLKIRRSKKVDSLLLKEMALLTDFSDKFCHEKEALELKSALNEPEEFISTVYQYSKSVYGMLYIYLCCYFSALLTIRHSTLSRYPDGSDNPLTFYNMKNNSVKFQPYFMQHLKRSLKLLSKRIKDYEKNQSN